MMYLIHLRPTEEMLMIPQGTGKCQVLQILGTCLGNLYLNFCLLVLMQCCPCGVQQHVLAYAMLQRVLGIVPQCSVRDRLWSEST